MTAEGLPSLRRAVGRLRISSCRATFPRPCSTGSGRLPRAHASGAFCRAPTRGRELQGAREGSRGLAEGLRGLRKAPRAARGCVRAPLELSAGLRRE
eukprot:14231619-Alexandrium_andersonii.AAC.1